MGLGPCPGFYRAFRIAGIPVAAGYMADFLELLAQKAWRSIEVSCPKCPETTPDEDLLLAALADIQHGRHAQASESLMQLVMPHAVYNGLPLLRRFGAAMLAADLPFPNRGSEAVASTVPTGGDAPQRSPDRGATLLH